MTNVKTFCRVIVVGSTGLVGGHLVEALTKSEAVKKIVCLARRPVACESSKVESHVIDFNNIESHAELLHGDVLFSCLGTTRRQAGSIAAQRLVDFDYQYQIAQLASKNAVSHYLLVSSSGANSTSLSPYLKMKGELEEAVAELGFAHLSIVQPALLLGNRQSKRMAESLAATVLPSLCMIPGLGKYRPIEGREVARKLVSLSVERPSNIHQPEFERLSLDDVFTHK